MASEKRLVDANALKKAIREENWVKDRKVQLTLDFIDIIIDEQPTVDAVVLPYPPRPMLKGRNPWNMDVYCPECGTNLSGYYGDDPLPIVTCFNCGEILDPHKTTTRTDGDGNG